MSKETSKKILGTITKCLLLLLIFAIIGVSAYFCLKGCGLTTTDDFIKLKNELGDSFLLWFIVGCLQIIQVIFIPITNQIITVPIAFVFNDDLLKVFFMTLRDRCIFAGSGGPFFRGEGPAFMGCSLTL